MVAEELDVGTVDLDAASGLLVEVLLAAEGSEAPVLGDNDLLATGELVLGAAESLEGNSAVYKRISSLTEQPNPSSSQKYLLASRVRTLMMI